MTFQPSEKEMESIEELRGVMQEVLRSEPGMHPEIPELIHRLLQAVITTLAYVLNTSDNITMELAQHKLNQEISDTALLKIFAELGIFGPETFQKAVVQTTEELGTINVGKA